MEKKMEKSITMKLTPEDIDEFLAIHPKSTIQQALNWSIQKLLAEYGGSFELRIVALEVTA